ncbi:hypothetical protein CKO42_17255 [Lamprobacter modestohalophilus]|uniref:CRISPR-associated endoribonuclease Cas2 n=1 Tax=Lamprobacter modestohalophilus TaxID=1064514 RepID=A0A9X0WAN7_9GAMM|nr:CRISPR-associated endonuclease Cas2 [Lamprobacter modestohalophilus]MBK1620157.1 hypothetical protein [Lamprobacter modestohalophilus]
MSLLERASGFERSGFERAMFVFSYDISSPKNARAVRRVLKRWRLDGQLSVHEAIVTPGQAEALGVELAEQVDPETDSLIVFRLSRRGHGPVMVLSAPTAPSFARLPEGVPRFPADGIYVLAYDVRHPKRLRRVQQATRSVGIFVQRSVYVYQGSGASLAALVNRLRDLLNMQEDDCRVYVLSGADDLWFFAGSPPPLAGLGVNEMGKTELASVEG